MQQLRHLAAILFTDIVGYTSMMQKDEQQAVVIVKRHNSVMQNTAAVHHGEVVNFYGDGCLCVFQSATEAVRCAIEIQQQLKTDPAVPLRIGLHSGEIFYEEGKVMGDTVNVASRIQSLGQANTILFSREIFDKIRNQQEFKSVPVGRFHFKNVDEPMEVFALANEGLNVPKRETIEGKLKAGKKIYSGKKIIIAVVMILLLIAISVAYNKYFTGTENLVREKSIAILPFKVIGNSEDALGDGLVADILAHLMKIKELKVISNRSSVKYADSKKSPKEIGEDLNVNSLMTGIVQQIGSRIKISAQLIDCKTGNMIWTDVYDRDKIQIFDLQTELSTQIVNALKAKLTSAEKSTLSKQYTENVEAYQLYRKGLYFWGKRTKESYDSAEVYYKRAIDLDPEYALAYSGLADCYTLNLKGLSTAEAMPIAKTYLAKALSLDSTLAEAVTTVGFIQSHYDYDWEGGKRILEKAIQLSPNYPTAHLYYGNTFFFNGDTQRGISETKEALDYDPLSIALNGILGRQYYHARKYDLAIIQLQKSLALAPDNLEAREWLGLTFLQKKLYSQAIDVFSKLPAKIPERGYYLSYAYAIAGDKTRAGAELHKNLARESSSLPYLPYWLALVYIGLENFNEALTQLEKVYEAKSIWMVSLKVDPIFDPIRTEPRFKALLKKIGFE